MGLVSIFVDRGCLFLFIATVVSILCKKFVDPVDPYKCGTLLTQGSWLENPQPSSVTPSYNDWSPSTCMMHKYTARDIQQCIGGRKVVFAGDSHVRQIFWALAAKLDPQQAQNELAKANKHSDQSFDGPGNPKLEFVWDPYLNSTTLSRELTGASLEGGRPGSDNSSSVIIIGGGLWFVKNLDEHSSESFHESVQNILTTLQASENARNQSRLFPGMLPQKNSTNSLMMFVPIQHPLYESLDADHAKTLTRARVEPLHRSLVDLSSQYSLPFLWAHDMISNQSENYQPDGLHFTENVVTSIADLILNAKCNNILTAVNGYPMDKTCCSKYPQLKTTQTVLIHATWGFPFVVWLIPWISTTAFIFFNDNPAGQSRLWNQGEKTQNWATALSESLPSPKISRAIAILLMTSFYCWLADRTHLYNKAQKHFDHGDFNILCLMTIFIGVLSLRRSKLATREKPSGSDATDDQFLSREQTDEWKGWMQVIILIYHFTGASKILWIYKIIRLLVAAYLFLTGYGHTIFFLTKADFSLKRVAGVLVRLNLLSCILPYVMQTDYLFYYFSPLVSFWYLVVYATMAIGKSWNRTLPLFTVKILMSATIVTNLISSQPNVFELVFSLLSKFCNIHWNATDWQFRLGLDKYIVYLGMMVAAYRVISKGKDGVFSIDLKDAARFRMANVPKAAETRSLLDALEYYVRDKTTAYLTVMGSGCLFYALFAYPAKDKGTHNSTFSIASIGPILAFIAIRNSFSWTRRFHSTILAWIGRHSLETFVLQFHIWLAADTKGVLSTGLFDRSQRRGRWLDFVLLTTIFLWICWHAADALQTLTSFIVELKAARQGHNVGKGLPVTKNGPYQEAKSLRQDTEASRADSAKKIDSNWSLAVRLPMNAIAESLWARLVLILCGLWCLNMLN